ncbi:MAG: hypothetical protein EU532_00335 [Promethearchaeota archaeon]|nr:MAG: hypothetical protein EU532_00335 [Candidatus Lokiarchaeota archaeon]
MPNLKDEQSKLDKGWAHYERIKTALDGLFDILTLNFDEDDIFYQCGVDNLERLKETIMDLLKNDYNSAEIKRKLRDLEFDMKKCLFFEKSEKKAGLKH